MKKITLVIFLTFVFQSVYSQILSNGSVTPSVVRENPFLDASTNFDASLSPNNEGKGLLFPRTDLTTWVFKLDLVDEVTFPTAFDGMIIYNTGSGNTLTGSNNPNGSFAVVPGFYYFSNPGATASVSQGQWIRMCSTFTSSTSGGDAIVSGYSCATASAGTITVGTPVSGVTQTITATVIQVGNYNITTSANGITFSASGTYAGTGPQNIVLTATGTPLAEITTSFTLNTTPNCNFTRIIFSPSTNGTANVSDYSCNTASTGVIKAGSAVTGVTQTITATVTTVGTYNISATANGVTFAASGTFAATGLQDIVLNATGTPLVAGTYSFSLNTTPNCSFTRTIINNPSTNGTGITSGYSCSTGITTGTLIAGTPASGVTQTITALVNSVGTYNISATANGVTFSGSGTFTGVGGQSIVLTATGTPLVATNNLYSLNTSPNCFFSRRTIHPSTNGSAIVSTYSCDTASAGTLIAGFTVSGVSQTITATVTTVGTYNITTSANGVTFSGSGSFTGTGNQNIVLTATGTPLAAGTNSFTLNTTPDCSFSRTTIAPLPGNITLGTVDPYIIASVFDQDYLPYTAPTATAELPSGALSEVANGVNEALTIDFQGTLTTTGITINIPYTVVTASVTLPAYSQTINIPASYTEDGISRDVTFSYNTSGFFAVGTGYVTATLRAVGGTLNVKKMDVQSGIGNDYLGWLLAQFVYATNNSGGFANFQFRALSVVPDKNIADANHVMFYLPVRAADGKMWLNNNLGADYANTTKAAFNPVQQATTYNDYLAYGSFFQWGRNSDGHELINWTSATTATAVNSITTTLATTDTPVNALFIINSSSSTQWDWRNPQNDNLWQGVAGTNNPCPVGYRLPTQQEWTTLISASSITNYTNAANSTLKITTTGLRRLDNGQFMLNGTEGRYMSSSILGSYRIARMFTSTSTNEDNGFRADGMSVRCIRN